VQIPDLREEGHGGGKDQIICLVGHLTTLQCRGYVALDVGMINEFGKKRSWPNQGTVSAFRPCHSSDG
jgi:hypothetical protein